MAEFHPQRRLAYWFAVTLVITLAALFVVWWVMFGPLGPPRPPEVAGVESVLVIDGPGEGSAPRFFRPMGVAVGKDDRIYVTDTGNNRVCVFDSNGRFLFEFGGHGVTKPAPGVMPNWEPGTFNFPVGIDADEAGDIYIADLKNDQIQVYTADGEFLRAFPRVDEVVGQGTSGRGGTGIAVTDVYVRDGLVYATDRYQVVVFTTHGEFVRQFGRPGRGDGELDHPNGIIADAQGRIYVSDSNHGRVIAFDAEGEPLWHAGRIPRGIDDRDRGGFGLPRGLTLADDGTLFVVDAFEFSVLAISGDGRLLDRYGDRGAAPAMFDFPNDIDRLGDTFVVADKENDRVQVVRLSGGDVSWQP